MKTDKAAKEMQDPLRVLNQSFQHIHEKQKRRIITKGKWASI